MNTRALTVALIAFALAACTSTPAITPSPGPTGSPVPTSPPTSPPTAPPTPTLVPTPTPTAEPTATPTAEPTTTPTVAPTATPTVEPTPVAGWTEPELIADGTFEETDIVVDSQGVVHVAAAGNGAGNRGIWYFTNASGEWASQQVSAPPREAGRNGYDGEPSIALDSDGSIWIAFTRWTCWDCAPNPPDGVWYATNASGSWNEAQQLAGEMCGSPSLVVRDGIASIAYEELGGWYFGKRNWPAWYTTNASGAWVTTEVTKKGSAPQLSFDADGHAQILYWAPNSIQFVTQLPDGSFGQAESLPGTADGFDLDMSIDSSSGQMWAGWSWYSADRSQTNTMVTNRNPGGWSQPVLAIENAILTGLAASQGFVYASAVVADPDNWGGLAFGSSGGGPFATEELSESGGDSSVVAVGASGTVYLVYSIASPKAKQGLWLLENAGV